MKNYVPCKFFFRNLLIIARRDLIFSFEIYFFSVVVLFAAVSPVLHQVFNRSFVWSILDIRQPKYLCMYMLKQVLRAYVLEANDNYFILPNADFFC